MAPSSRSRTGARTPLSRFSFATAGRGRCRQRRAAPLLKIQRFRFPSLRRGGGTRVEAATEMPARLRAILGKDAKPRVIIVDRNSAIAPDMGAGPRPVTEDALRKLGVETRLGTGVAALDQSGVTLSDGQRIETETVIWAPGFRAAPLTAQMPAERDNLGRLLVDRDLRVPRVAGVFATGDAARAASDDLGNYALMSCQHATRMGAFAGTNGN